MGLSLYLLRSISRVAGIVGGLIVLTFFMSRVVANPVTNLLGIGASEDQRKELAHALGLDRPLPVQFGHYLWNLLHGDAGVSLWQHQPALGLVLHRLPASLLLAGVAILAALVTGFTLGILGGLRPDSLVDRIATLCIAAALGVPDFWLAIVFIIIFAVKLGWLPTGGYEGLSQWQYVVLPAVTVAMLPTGRLAAVVRDAVREEMSKQYIVAARARGLSTREIIQHHLLRNIGVSASTIAGYDFLLMLTGSIATVEVVFGWPGVGRLAVESTLQGDVVLVSAIVLVTGLIIGIGNIGLELMSAVIDRRRAD
jgi:peptide/nickel transport system permease protein